MGKKINIKTKPRSKKKLRILTNSTDKDGHDCLTTDEIKASLRNPKDTAERKRIEEIASRCETCRDLIILLKNNY